MTDSDACQWDEPQHTAEHKSSRSLACLKATRDGRGAWLQETELINDDTRKKIHSSRCGRLAMPVAKQTTTKLEQPN